MLVPSCARIGKEGRDSVRPENSNARARGTSTYSSAGCMSWSLSAFKMRCSSTKHSRYAESRSTLASCMYQARSVVSTALGRSGCATRVLRGHALALHMTSAASIWPSW